MVNQILEYNRSWWKGVVVLREFGNGMFDPEFVSLSALGREYG